MDAPATWLAGGSYLTGGQGERSVEQRGAADHAMLVTACHECGKLRPPWVAPADRLQPCGLAQHVLRRACRVHGHIQKHPGFGRGGKQHDVSGAQRGADPRDEGARVHHRAVRCPHQRLHPPQQDDRAVVPDEGTVAGV